LDLQDDTLTKNAELSVPDEEMLVYQKYNSEGTVPTFVFGCKYVRTGNGFERKNDLKAEEAEFRGVIEDLIKKNMMG
jgi:hypothetical protein